MLTLLLCVGVAAAARLDNTYLPPSSAGSAGGNGNFLAAPNGGSNGGSLGNTYLPPAVRRNGNGNGHGNGNGVPQQQYGAPLEATNGLPASSPVGPSPVYGVPNGHYNGNGRSYASPEARASILRFNNENNGDGNYRFEYETENKISQQELGQVKDVAPEGGVTVVQGTYSYVGDDGQTYTVNYVADENGFQPTGDHIHSDIQQTAAEAARSAASEVGYPGGYNGRNGYNGQNGYSGQNGYNGQNGQNGQNGYNGQNGQNGQNGYNGQNGQNGQNGYNGQNGSNGHDAQNGYRY